MATKSKKAAPKKKAEKAAEPTVNSFAQFLPQAGQDVNEYLKGVSLDPAKIPGKSSPEPEAKPSMMVRPQEMASMMERQVKMSRRQDEAYGELAASKEGLGGGAFSDFVTSEKGGGTYDYGMGTYHHPKSLSSSLSHFTEFHRIHTIVEHALDKHSATAEIKLTPGSEPGAPLTRTGPFDTVAKHLTNASQSIDRALAKHTEGTVLSKQEGSGSSVTIDQGAMSHFTEAIGHLKKASTELVRRTNGQFPSIDKLANGLHGGYKKQVDDATSSLSLMTNKQREIEARGLMKDEDDTPPRPEVTRPPLLSASESEAQSAATAATRAGRKPAYRAGAPREMFMAKPVKASGDMKFKPQENEVDEETGRAQSVTRARSEGRKQLFLQADSLYAQRLQRRAKVRQALNDPQYGERNQKARENLTAQLNSRAKTFPQSESRISAFKVQQESAAESPTRTIDASEKAGKGTALKDSPFMQQRVAASEERVKSEVQGHINDGNISDAALTHFRNQSFTPSKEKSAISAIKNNPHRYLATHGFDAGERPRQVQERTAPAGTAAPRIRKSAAPGRGSTGEIVSRAKANTRNNKEHFGQGTSSSTPYTPKAQAAYEKRMRGSDPNSGAN